MTQPILKEYCKMGTIATGFQDISDYLECFCFNGDDPFILESTTTTTPAPGPQHYPPKLYTTTTQAPAPDCNVPQSCMDAMHNACGPHDGGTDCYTCLKNWWPFGAAKYGCEIPTFDQQTLTFCMCGTATPKDNTKVPTQILGIENSFGQAVTLSAKAHARLGGLEPISRIHIMD